MQKIGQQKNNRAAMQDVIQKAKRAENVCALPARLVHQQFPDDSQNMSATFAGRDEHFNFIRKQQQRHLVAILGGGHGERGGDFSGKLAFAPVGRAEAG